MSVAAERHIGTETRNAERREAAATERNVERLDPALVVGLRDVERRRAQVAWLTLAPAVLFLLVIFVGPIASIFYYAIDTSDARNGFPRTAAALADWDGKQAPTEAACRALVADLRSGFASKAIYPAARELNNRLPGVRSALVSAGRAAQQWPPDAGSAELLAHDPAWGALERWRTIKSAVAPLSAYRLFAALDLRSPPSFGLPMVAPEDQRIFITYLGRTFWISAVVTLLCLALGYPLAYMIATARPSVARVLLTLTLLPFWTSILVRTAAWVIILQQQGMVNDFLQWAGIVEHPLTLIYNRFGVYVAMTHVLLPFMVLPLYSVMKGIPRQLLPAAASLGAKPIAAFLQVYLPQSKPGVAAGCLMTFILALGYYVTPALVGGATDQMESGMIAHFALEEGNWGMAASLAAVLLFAMSVIYGVYSRFAKASAIRLM